MIAVSLVVALDIFKRVRNSEDTVCNFIKMNGHKTLFRILLERKWPALEAFRKFHVFPNLKHRQLPYSHKDPNIDRSLFLTTLPAKKRDKRPRHKIQKMASGPLLISCKNTELNHHQGMTYGKFDPVPLASKGWHHKKSKGDYFTIMPAFEHPAFISSKAIELPKTFEELGISNAVIEELKKMGVHNPTVIQAKSVDKLLRGQNVTIAAETGCGKTLAYVIPMMENILKFKDSIPWEVNSPFGIILVPSKELAAQVGNVVTKLGSGLGLHCVTLISGDFDNHLKDPSVEVTDVIVTTLGIMMRYMNNKIYSTSRCRLLILDEADIFLDPEFLFDLCKFLKMANLNLIGLRSIDLWPNSCQLCLTSATALKFPADIQDMIPVQELELVSTGYLHKVMLHVRQHFMRLTKAEKPETLLRIVKKNIKNKIPTLIFSNRISTCNFVQYFLTENNVESARITSDMFSDERLKGLMDFKSKKIFILTCTDCMSRGLDMPWVKQIINYEFPNNIPSYIHRCGRIGRLGYEENCLVINFVSGRNEIRFVNEIEKAARTGMELTLKLRRNIVEKKEIKRKARRRKVR